MTEATQTATEPAVPAAQPESPTTSAPEPAVAAEPAAAPLAPEIPETYKFVVPEGVELSQAALEKFTPLFKEVGLTQENAQKLITAQSELSLASRQAMQQQYESEVEAQTSAWRKELETDKEFGGDNLPATSQAVERVLGQYGDPALKEFFKTTGLDNHPGLIRAFARIGKAMGEDVPNKPTDSRGNNKPMHERMYPNMK